MTDACYFCGTYTNAEGYESNGSRHWLSDCRPDLVQHEIGPLCTWPRYEEPEYQYLNDRLPHPGCYAYQIFATGEWTTEHAHFHQDGPL